MMNNTYLE